MNTETESTMPEVGQTDDFDMDFNSDDVANLISYVNPPDGVHIYGAVFCGMDAAWNAPDAPRGVRIIYQKLATIEKSKETDLDAPNGSLMSESFTGNEMGKKLLKQRLSQIFGEAYKGGAFRPYIESLATQKMSAFHLQLTTKVKMTTKIKDGEKRFYENVRINACVPVACITLPEGFEQFEYEPAEAG